MLTVLAILGVLAVLFAAGVVATREGPILADARPDVADLDLPAEGLQPEDVREVRFGLAVRGYRMSEVDEVLERLADALAERDAEISALQARARQGTVTPRAAASEPMPSPSPSPSPSPDPDPGPQPTPSPSPAPEPKPSPSPQPRPTPEPPAPPFPQPTPPFPPSRPSPIVPPEPPSPIVPTEPPLDSPPQAGSDAAPPVDVAMVKVEVAPLPERPAGESEDTRRD